MKKMLIALAAAFILTTTAMAQDNKETQNGQRRFDPKEMIQHMTNRTADRYGLTDEQADKLLDLNTRYADKLRFNQGPRQRGQRPGGQRNNREARQNNESVDGLTAATRPSREEMEARRKQAEEDRKAYNAELKEIMTAEQYAQYEADQQQMRQRFQQRQPRNRQ